jgi:hypothetical protein
VQNQSGYIPALNQWTHIEAVVTTAGQMSMYANGKLVYGPVAYSYNPYAPGVLGIAQIPNSSGAENYQGKIDQIKIYDYARTPAQVAYDYNRGGPVGWWKMDECQGNTINDASGNGNNGVLTVGATGSQSSIGTCTTSGTAWGSGANGKFGAGLNFDGTSDYVLVNSSEYKFPSGDFTASVWAKPAALDGTWDGLISTDSNADSAWRIVREAGNSFFSTRYYTTTLDFPAVVVGDWHNYTVKKAGTTFSIYLDGKFVTSAVCSATNVGGSGQMVFGSYRVNDALTPNHMYAGQMDDIRMYNYALSDQQIAGVVNAGSALRFGN